MNEAEVLLRLVEVVLLASLIELLWLLTHVSAAPRGLLPNLLAGTSLALALRLGLGGAGVAWVGACLVSAGVCHLFDLRARWHRPVAPPIPDASRQERSYP